MNSCDIYMLFICNMTVSHWLNNQLILVVTINIVSNAYVTSWICHCNLPQSANIYCSYCLPRFPLQYWHSLSPAESHSFSVWWSLYLTICLLYSLSFSLPRALLVHLPLTYQSIIHTFSSPSLSLSFSLFLSLSLSLSHTHKHSVILTSKSADYKLKVGLLVKKYQHILSYLLPPYIFHERLQHSNIPFVHRYFFIIKPT